MPNAKCKQVQVSTTTIHDRRRHGVWVAAAVLTATDRSAREVASSTEALLVLELVEVGAAVDGSLSVAGRLATAGPMSGPTLHPDHALCSNAHTQYR